ncbi:PREDICTED: trihelix transcription factor ASIL2-like [Ipomoea nil]|uniref:trihelix transcription factor ASIL2-like n=1 Tax=Ipomoea nil TaxID=35883 RepID=UPI000900BD61|nr:PREDICTED: trihelix transcription factor ASIL2-like [Ipomoea nil]
MGEMADSLTATAPSSRPLPFREDCWSEEATATLVDAWGRRFMELNRGNLRHKDWQDVADAVNELHGHTKKGRRTDVQCKNRIDTLKKKYKAEKAKIVESDGTLTASTWPFFSRLDVLIGNSGKQQFPKVSPVMAASASTLPLPSPSPSPLLLSLPSPPIAVPLAYRWPTPAVVLPQKRPAPAMDDSYFRRNYSAVAAAAAAAAATEDKDANEYDGREESEEEMEASEGIKEEDGIRRLAKAIERFGAIYERVEGMKRRQMIELEKQRMEFAKDLELQRMQLFMDTQVQLEKIKQAKRPASDDIYS